MTAHTPCSALIALHGVSKTYTTGEVDFTAIDRVELTIAAGEFVGIVGPSGSGKSTLLNLVAAIDRPSEGHVMVGDVEVSALSENEAARWRGNNLGVIFQFFQLLPTLSLADNVMFRWTCVGRSPSRNAPTSHGSCSPRSVWPTTPTSCRHRSPATERPARVLPAAVSG